MKRLGAVLFLVLMSTSVLAEMANFHDVEDWAYWYDTGDKSGEAGSEGYESDGYTPTHSTLFEYIKSPACDAFTLDMTGPDDNSLKNQGAFDRKRYVYVKVDNYPTETLPGNLHHNSGVAGWSVSLYLDNAAFNKVFDEMVNHDTDQVRITAIDENGNAFTSYFSLHGYIRATRAAAKLCKTHGQ